MPRRISPLLPSTDELLRQLGERLRLARLRRRLSAKHVATRAGMAPMTLRSVERGGSGVTIGAYLAVMQVLGVEKDLDLLAAADPTGRSLQDARLSAHRKAEPRMFRAPAQKTDRRDASVPRAQEAVSKPKTTQSDARRQLRSTPSNSIENSRGRVTNSRFTRARELAAFLEVPSVPRARRR
jgi:transcriptional regulator with XRE-family HTH domain